MKTEAAVLVELNQPLVIADLELPALKPGQVIVDVAFSGVCHTQLLECRGYRGPDPYLPHCLGHEGSGVVIEISSGVTKVKEGDHVILSWIKGSGANVNSTTYGWAEGIVNAGAITTFNQQAVISENRLTVITDEVSLKTAALLGCAVPTGSGAVFNVAKPMPGQSIVVFGTGGIGLCAVMAASLASCVPIIAVDLVADKLESARQLGATHLVDASQSSPTDIIKQICPNGVDFAIEATGRPAVMQQSIESVRNQGGTVVVIGNARHGEMLEFNPWHLNLGKKILGTWGGDSIPERDYPRYCKLTEAGKLNLTPFLNKPTYTLQDINIALADLEAGKVARPVIKMENLD